MSCKFRQPKVTYFDCNVKKKILVLKNVPFARASKVLELPPN